MRKLDKAGGQGFRPNTFEAVALEWHSNQIERWTVEHAGRTLRRLERDVFSVIG